MPHLTIPPLTEGETYIGAAKSTGRIATVPLRDGFWKRNTADACLIAAAPDMLGALFLAEKLVARLEYDDDYTDGQVETMHAIRAAIKKATDQGTIAIDI